MTLLVVNHPKRTRTYNRGARILTDLPHQHFGDPLFVEQAGFDPPMITAAVSNGRRIITAIEQSGFIGINVLGEEDARLMKPFTQRDNDSPFSGLELEENQHSIPQLTEALAFLACRVTGKIEGGDHTIYAAEVIDGILNDSSRQPMVRIRKNGFQY